MHLLQQVQVQNQDPAADGVFTHDLAVNPLSVVLIHLRPLNDTGTLGDFQDWLGICDAVNRVNITHQGMSVVSASGRDLAVLAAMRHGCVPWQATNEVVNNERRIVTLPIFMGRAAYDSKSCFPASRAGELIIELDLDIAGTGYDDLQYTIETIEILGAKPSEWERKVSLAQTFAATGIRQFDLPVNNMFRGALLFGTTSFDGASPAPSWGRVSLQVDGVEMGLNGVDFESLHMFQALRGVPVPGYDSHIHTENDTGGPTDVPHRVGGSEGATGGYRNYAFLDLDPTRDDSFSIDTTRVSRLQLRADVETANACRVIPIERVKV